MAESTSGSMYLHYACFKDKDLRLLKENGGEEGSIRSLGLTYTHYYL